MEVDGLKVIYWNVNYPFPMSNRDVSFSIFPHLPDVLNELLFVGS